MKLITRIALLAAALVLPAWASAGTYVSVTVAPPPLPVYAQPVCPGDGYIWTPGYWAWDGDEYYWVPGTWVFAPATNVFWTPGYWGWSGGYYVWRSGYWGPHVGFYGGVNYGYGYGGVGYAGGRWQRGVFHYNTAVNNINVVKIRNTYRTTVINNNSGNRVSFNGGRGGLKVQPTKRELAATRDNHIGWTSVQQQHQRSAASDRAMRFSQNHGKPAIAATQRPSAFNDRNPQRGKDQHDDRDRMNSSNFAPRVDSRQNNGNAPNLQRDHGSSMQRGGMPSSSYAPHDRQPTQGNTMRREDLRDRAEMQRPPSPQQMERPQQRNRPQQMNGPRGGERPQPERHRVER